MSNENITVCVCSRQTDKEKEEFLTKLRESCKANAHVMFMINNGGMALTSIYKDVLEKCETDIVVFVHDDVEFLKDGWGEEVIRLFNEHEDYGIIGVAGSAEFDKTAAWWQYKKIYGQVLHRHDGKTWLSAFSPLLKTDLQEVCVVDGLFFAVHKKRISQTFDTNFQGFNFYEIDFCLANFLDKKTKIGVTTNIRLAHNSIGEMKPNWYENREKLNEKYKDYYPIKV